MSAVTRRTLLAATAATAVVGTTAVRAETPDPLLVMEGESRHLEALANAAETDDDVNKLGAAKADVDEAMIDIAATTLAGVLAKVRTAYHGYIDEVWDGGIGDRLMGSAIEDLERLAG